MSWVKANPSTLSPIVNPTLIPALLCEVQGVREMSGEHRGSLIDCRTLDGDAFCLPGHVALLSKIALLQRNTLKIAMIRHLGKVKNYEDYEVEGWTGSLEELLRDPSGQQAYADTQRLVSDSRKLSSFDAPPADHSIPPPTEEPPAAPGKRSR